MFKDKLKSLRKSHNLTQLDLAAEMNQKFGLKIDRSMISKWETGFQEPEAYNIKCLAQIFGVSMDYLADTETESEDSGVTAAKVALFGGAGNVTDEMWDEVVRFADYIKNKEANGNDNK